MLRDFLFRLRTLLRRSRAESDLDEELRFHLEREAEKYGSAGIPAEEARRRARLAFGGLDQTKESCRDVRGVAWLETIARDCRHALRVLRAQPLFTATVILSLTLGIGANIAIFSLLRAALWKPLPVEHPEQIVHLERVSPDDPEGGMGYSYVLYQLLKDAAKPDAGVVAKSGYGMSWFGASADSRERVAGESVSGNFFTGLRVRPFAGRLLVPQDDIGPAGRNVAVLSYDFWMRRFQGDRSVLGRSIYFREAPFTVIGIAQPGFNGVEAGTAIAVWVPISADPDIPKQWLTDPKDYWLRLLARVPPGSYSGNLTARLDNRFRSHSQQVIIPGASPHYKPLIAAQHLYLRPASAGLSTLGRAYEQPLLILLGAVILVLLIGCANVANLIMARNRARETELAVRRALGASRGRITSQLFVESLILALSGAAAGVLLAAELSRLLITLLPASQPPITFDLKPDFVMLTFAAGLGIATALLFGLLPGFHASGAADLRTGMRVTRRSAAGHLLVTGQLALSLVLMIGAGLFLDTVHNLSSADLGFHPESVTTFDLSLPKAMPADRRRKVFDDVHNRLNHVPGIAAATWAWPTVFSPWGWSNNIQVEGSPVGPGGDNETDLIAAGPDFAEAMGMTLLQGRFLTEKDVMNDAPVAVVNEAFARDYFGGGSPLGHRVTTPGTHSVPREIVGVVRNVRHHGPRNLFSRMVYVPVFREGAFFVRSSMSPAFLAPLIRTAASAADKSAQVDDIGPFETVVDDMSNRERMVAALSTCFGGMALLLSAIGLFGVMAYAVACRTQELGIRLALGAQRSNVQWLILRETVVLIVVGAAIGAAAAFALTRLLTGLLYGVKPIDIHVFAGAAFILALVGAVAGFLPAWRASRIDPVVSLRYE